MNTKLLLLALTIMTLPLSTFADGIVHANDNLKKLLSRTPVQISDSMGSANISALSKGGGIDGGGGDGLEMKPIDSTPFKGTINVPIPGDITKLDPKGMILVKGESGSGQPTDVTLYLCDTDSNGRIELFGCAGDDSLRAALNNSKSIAPGVYRVDFAGTTVFIKVLEGKTTEIELTKIQIPAHSATISFSVFTDFTSEKMRKLAALKSFSSETVRDQYLKDCYDNHSQNYKPVCGAFETKNPNSLIGPYLRFDSQGSQSVLDIGYGQFNPANDWIDQSGGNKEFVSVLPGIYKITISNSENNHSDTQYGIVAE